MKYRPIVLLAILLLQTACNLPRPASTVSVSTLPLETSTPIPLPPPTVAVPSATMDDDGKSTSGDAECVPQGKPEPFQAATFEDYPLAIQRYLNQGASLEALDDAIYNAGIANQPVAAAAAEMTGDGKQEIIVSIFDPQAQSLIPTGKLLIYACLQQRYELVFEQSSEAPAGAPGIRYLQDLNADGQDELVSSSIQCGASTCFEEFAIWAWMDDSFENRMEGISRDLPSPTFEIADPDQDGLYSLAITAAGAGSVGAGPQRSLTRIWDYREDTGLWVPSEERYGESNARIHVLHDAEASLAQENHEEALLLYQRVINDVTLDDWMNPETEQKNLAAYARFKIMVIYSILEQLEFAEITLNELNENYPVESSQYAYVEMAEAFWTAFQREGLAAGCAEAERYAAQHPQNILSGLGSASFGYANPDFQPENVCP